jgi:transposase
MYLSESFFSALPTSLVTENTKFFIVFRDSLSSKKAYFSGKRVQLLGYDPSFGSNFIEVTEEHAKAKHLGKVRCLGLVADEFELLQVFSKYFSFSISTSYSPPLKKEIIVKEKKRKEKVKIESKPRLEIKADQMPSDRDEKELIIAYRNTQDIKEKNRIFGVILFQRGVNGKTWDKIIRNYVSYNKHKFAHLQDRSENDFYQDIVIALHKQVDKWFDPSRNVCFSTYAWYVINCSFHRVLQLLSTQKRKASYVRNNLDLDDSECSWDESISIEKTQLPQQLSFEQEFEYRNLCSQVMKMFELKPIKASEELKQELLEVIRDKSTMQNSLYTLAKKFKIDVDEIFILERDLRENLKNSMYRDIILNMKEDINADEEIAKKYKRSKGHVIKMKRQLTSIVKTKLKGITI